jgi:hypothetical protein
MYHQLKHCEILHVAVRLIYVFLMNLIKRLIISISIH